MRAHEIFAYLDLDRVSNELLAQLQDVFDRELKRPIDLQAIEVQYGQASADVELQQARAELAKTSAEAEKLRAAAAKDRVAAISQFVERR